MRKFKFRPAFSAYTTLIGALSAVHESDLMFALFHQMQELGYEVDVHLFTTLIRVFAKEGRVDAALSLLDEMKSNSFHVDVVLYNVCIDFFGKAGKVDIAWKFFHEMKANGLAPDDVTYTSMIGVLCKANRLEEVVELFEQMDHNRKVPCVYAYNTMIMGYGLAGIMKESRIEVSVMSAAQVDPRDKMRSRDVNKVARGEQAPGPPHDCGTVSPPPPYKPNSSKSSNKQHHDDHDNDDNKMESSETAPNDDRFPVMNQTRHCYARYIEYHKCVEEKVKNAPECEKFAKYYRSLCPHEWIEKWNEQRELGTFPGPV
ncbi:hypothetical protein Pint_01175 [Pistacia integerrima]|uniref:Uncharacterized protein n=1 Tax=Pistacia integerrima TaxID=434235 RepID=A0ACC0ZGN0_9ROSI|nr:hypothetical protein Pint_01175 [Pistacia integerrima]